MKYKYVIGIDPAFRKGGFGVCVGDFEKKELHFVQCQSFVDFWVFGLPIFCCPPQDIKGNNFMFVVENSNLQNESFDLKGSTPVVARKARNVGTNQAASQICVDFLKFYLTEKHVLDISPAQKGIKWNKLQFAQILKQEKWAIIGSGTITQDMIDAAKLVINSPQYISMYHNG